MMLGGGYKHTDAVRQVGELWALREDSGQFRAWKYWMQLEFGIRFFGKWLTVTTEWPPTSQLGADRYAQFLSDTRDAVDKEKGCKTVGRPVPQHPAAWNGHIPEPPKEETGPYVDIAYVREFYRKHGLNLDRLRDIPGDGKSV